MPPSLCWLGEIAVRAVRESRASVRSPRFARGALIGAFARVPSQDECAFHANDDCPYEWCQEGK
eukprot:1389278-Prymnesium_polylepis.1